MKEYFSHDHNARNDQKILRLQMKHGMAGVGVFWCICEMLAEEDGYIMRSECDRIAFELRTESELVQSVINDFGLFAQDEVKFWSESLLKRLQNKYDKSEKARQSAEIRWNKIRNANASETQSEGNAIKLNESKVNERKVNEKNECAISKVDEVEKSFDLWWNLYDKKIDQKKCKACWKKLSWDDRREIWKHTQKYVLASSEKQYRKNPLTYLRGENWHDIELTEKKVAPKNKIVSRSITDVRNDILNGVDSREMPKLITLNQNQ